MKTVTREKIEKVKEQYGHGREKEKDHDIPEGLPGSRESGRSSRPGQEPGADANRQQDRQNAKANHFEIHPEIRERKYHPWIIHRNRDPKIVTVAQRGAEGGRVIGEGGCGGYGHWSEQQYYSKKNAPPWPERREQEGQQHRGKHGSKESRYCHQNARSETKKH